jgi:RimJ/RimL family protein N-acetyltransferase
LLPERALAFPVVLRALDVLDAPRVAQLAGEREIAEPTGVIPHPYPDGAAAAWIAEQARARAAGREYTYAVASVDQPSLVGAISLRPIAIEHENLGFWIGRPYWGRGYATAAARAVIALAFGLLDVEALNASHLVRNPASGRVMEKCGMQLVANETREHRGAREEFHIRGITREQWERLVAADAA